MTLRKTDYHPITLADKATVIEYLKRYPQTHSECSFMNMICWMHYARYEIAEVRNHLLIACTVDNHTTYHPPLGELDPELFEEVLELSHREGGKMAMDFFDKSDVDYMRTYHPEIPVYTNRAFYEYYYKTTDLAELHGKKYLNIRSQINKFKAAYQHTTEKITVAAIPELHEMLDLWCISKHCDSNQVLRQEADAVRYALDNWANLGCEGLFIRIKPENTIAGLAIWDELNPSTALIHFEKGFSDYIGIYKVINQETAKTLVDRYEWINRESDLDVPGLREAKLRYHPDHCAPAWYIKRSEIVI